MKDEEAPMLNVLGKEENGGDNGKENGVDKAAAGDDAVSVASWASTKKEVPCSRERNLPRGAP